MPLHNTFPCMTTLLLCLSLSSISPQALQFNAAVEVSQENRTSPPQQGRTGEGVASVYLAVTTQDSPSERVVTRVATRQDNGQIKPSSTAENKKEEYITINESHEDNTTQETSNKKVRQRSDEGKQETVIQQDSNIGINEWFTDTLNVTLTPEVTWTRHAAPHRFPSSPQKTESPESTEQPNKDEAEDIILTVTFVNGGQPFILDLHPNRDLLAATYRESSDRESGEDDTLPREIKALPCEYQGVVRGVAKTWAALSVCGGLRGVVSGTLEEGHQVDLLVEPSPGSTSSRGPHTVISSALLSLPDGFCGVKDAGPLTGSAEKTNDSNLIHEKETNTSLPYSRRTRRWAGLTGEHVWYEKNTKFVELVLVVDHSFFVTHGDETRSRCKAIVNIVNALYRPLNVVVVLSHLEVWEHSDKISVTADYDQNLKQLKTYRKNMLNDEPHYNNDNTMLLTTVDFTGATVGFAIVSGMCGITGSSGVVQDKNRHLGITAYTLAHEMGHNFGMKHDEDEENSCQCTSCIMSGQSSYKYKPHISWSSCSRRVIERNLDSISYKCLNNVPTRMYPITSCGDGVVNADEQCDCGPSDFCNNPCCVATTCKLAVNASCASGPCCDAKTCQIKPAGTECRATSTDCDLPEFCSGDSESCPEDVIKGDGAPCSRGQGHCYQGECGSHEAQCHGIWGEGARVADQRCYSRLNKQGGSNGNCGYSKQSKTGLLPCADGDELCGSLHCLPEPDTKPGQLGAEYRYGSMSFSNAVCSYIISSDSLPTSYWLTPDGAKCGKNKMCMNQKCVSVPEPAGDCRGGCSGRGVCNNRNHCHCDPGFAPPDCSKKGSGGSIDSNKIGRNRYKDPLLEAVFILSLILLGIAIVICCLWSHIRRWWEAGGRGKICHCCACFIDACCCPLMSLITDYICIKKKKKNQSKVAQDDYERDKMICQVDLDLKDSQFKTNTWGVASEKLVTDVITTTPKNSLDYKRKILLPSNQSAPHPKTPETSKPPTYTQSISVDSGCVPDADDTIVREPFGSQMSMKSLVSVFKSFRSQSSSSLAGEENEPSKTNERQQSMRLSRFVVDPLAGSRRSRQGTPPPNHVKPEWRRSISMDTKTSPSRCLRAPPPPPPLLTGKPSKLSNDTGKSNRTCRATEQGVVKLDDNGQGKTFLGSNRPVNPTPGAPSTTPSLQSKAKKPLMPPSKKNITSVTTDTKPSQNSLVKSHSSSKTTQEKINGPPKRPLLPPGKGSTEPSGVITCGSVKQRVDKEPSLPSLGGGRVKDLARKLEK